MKTLILHLTFAAIVVSPTVVRAQNTTSSPAASGFGSALMDEKAFDDSFGKLPTNITSDALTFNAKSRVFTYQGNVQVTQGDMRLTAKLLEGTYSEQNQLQKLVAKGDVHITKQDIEATGQVASYDANSAVVTLTENPQLQQQESVLRADRIKIFLNENRSQAEGDVRVTFVNNKDDAKKTSEKADTSAQPSAASPQSTPAPQLSPTPQPIKPNSPPSTSTTKSAKTTPTAAKKPTKKPTPKPTKKPTPKSTPKKKA